MFCIPPDITWRNRPDHRTPVTALSTTDWRSWWREQSVIDGTDWISLIEAAADVIDQLLALHVAEGSIVSESFRRFCAEADARKARGESPRYIQPSRWQEPPSHIPPNWESMSIQVLMAHFDRARRDGAPQATVEALKLGLRERGTEALEEPAVKRPLSQLSEQQLHEVCGRLQRLKPEIARAWGADAVTVLIKSWNMGHG